MPPRATNVQRPSTAGGKQTSKSQLDLRGLGRSSAHKVPRGSRAKSARRDDNENQLKKQLHAALHDLSRLKSATARAQASKRKHTVRPSSARVDMGMGVSVSAQSQEQGRVEDVQLVMATLYKRNAELSSELHGLKLKMQSSAHGLHSHIAPAAQVASRALQEQMRRLRMENVRLRAAVVEANSCKELAIPFLSESEGKQSVDALVGRQHADLARMHAEFRVVRESYAKKLAAEFATMRASARGPVETEEYIRRLQLQLVNECTQRHMARLMYSAKLLALERKTATQHVELKLLKMDMASSTV
jgi:formylmethanofuran dehydrogenase subunit E